MEGRFFKVKTSQEVLAIIDGFHPLDEEFAAVEQGLGRVLSRDITAPEDLPAFSRSSVDGFAVRARDTFGATEAMPALCEIKGEVIMGEVPEGTLWAGTAWRIPTGGMLPEGADAVVMVEHSHLLDEKTVEITRPVSPLENVILPGDDFGKGSLVLGKGHRLRSQDLGVLAGLGILRVPVARRPRVAVISTGDEIVPIGKSPKPGQVRDINRITLSAFCINAGAEPFALGIFPDRFDAVAKAVRDGLEAADMVWISGGSSVGTRDLTLKVFETIPEFELLAHGISISPGKPTIIGKSRNKALVGLPGHVVSALVVAEIFMGRLLSRLSGESPVRTFLNQPIEAVLSRNVESAPGREDYIRVRLKEKQGIIYAEPIFAKSGLISSLVVSDGLIRIDVNCEGLYEGEKVPVLQFSTGLRTPWNGTPFIFER
ncbi:MAG: molybdopterin molybdenumtransferase MoeA [Desulfobacteraceae bacterium]|nr:MAG: molybdopterin molybdenumtransferase MoeA [Desulfobacteraceae bacterium]